MFYKELLQLSKEELREALATANIKLATSERVIAHLTTKNK